jgi:hypothetical protein
VLSKATGRLLSIRSACALTALSAALLHAPRANAGDAASCIAANNRGNDLALEGKLLAARAELARCAAASCPKIIADECAALVARVGSNIPTVVVAATDPSGRDVSPIHVYLDGRLEQSESGRAIALDPGQHDLRVVAADGRSASAKLVALEGQKNRLVRIDLPATAGVEPAREETTAAPAERASGAPAAAWVLGGVGIVALGSFGYFALRGNAKENDLEEKCAPRCTDSQADELYRNYLIADVSLGVGVVALGAATYLFVTAAKSKAESVAIRVAPARGGAQLGMRLNF